MKVALVHDYLNDFGGAERVLLALSEIFPNAPIYTIYFKKSSKAYNRFKDKKIIRSSFGYVPFADKLISPLRFLIPFVWSSFDFSDYDLVITSANWAVTKGVKKGPKTKEICYLHSPPRYLYGYDTSRNWESGIMKSLIKAYSLIVNHFMRVYDFKSAQKVDFFIVNSKNIGKRLEKFYRRKDYKVIYPPVDIEKFSKIKKPLSAENYYLTGGRLVAAKNFDLIIKAAKKAKVKLKIFGQGFLEPQLKRLGGKNIEFLGHIKDDELVAYYQNAKAFIVAQKDEDFGITPIEAAAAGCPTIAFRAGGYLESIMEDKTGVFFNELDADSIVKAIKKSQKIDWNKKTLYSNAAKFSKTKFNNNIKKYISQI